MIIPNPIVVPLTIQEPPVIALTVSSDSVEIPMQLSTEIRVIGGAHYEGEYEVTPTQETQTLSTAGLVMDADVTINPIPSNYGLITWDGSVLTVS